jgi:hypothetical protein
MAKTEKILIDNICPLYDLEFDDNMLIYKDGSYLTL